MIGRTSFSSSFRRLVLLFASSSAFPPSFFFAAQVFLPSFMPYENSAASARARAPIKIDDELMDDDDYHSEDRCFCHIVRGAARGTLMRVRGDGASSSSRRAICFAFPFSFLRA